VIEFDLRDDLVEVMDLGARLLQLAIGFLQLGDEAAFELLPLLIIGELADHAPQAGLIQLLLAARPLTLELSDPTLHVAQPVAQRFAVSFELGHDLAQSLLVVGAHAIVCLAGGLILLGLQPFEPGFILLAVLEKLIHVP
jgi:hypothetical protein